MRKYQEIIPGFGGEYSKHPVDPDSSAKIRADPWIFQIGEQEQCLLTRFYLKYQKQLLGSNQPTQGALGGCLNNAGELASVSQIYQSLKCQFSIGIVDRFLANFQFVSSRSGYNLAKNISNWLFKGSRGWSVICIWSCLDYLNSWTLARKCTVSANAINWQSSSVDSSAENVGQFYI